MLGFEEVTAKSEGIIAERADIGVQIKRTFRLHGNAESQCSQTLAILEERRAEFGRRRDYLLPALRALGLGIAVEPEGAFYLYADISAFGDDAFAFCRHFLETEHVALTPIED